MVSAEVIKGVQELLHERGIHKRPDEELGDYVARGLGITSAQAETLLSTLHDGGTVEDAVRAASLGENVDHNLLIGIARAVGSALGRLKPSA